MKKTAVLVVCVLLLCGGFCHLYLAAQVKEAENVFTLVQSPVATTPLSPIIPAGDFMIAETSTPQPVLRSVTAFTPSATYQPVPPVAVVPAKTTPDISKFRLPIEYKLKNIPVESLIDFLEEEFPQVVTKDLSLEVAMLGETAMNILITASLADHRTIKDMLVELEREVATLRSEAANVAELDHPASDLPIFSGHPLQ